MSRPLRYAPPKDFREEPLTDDDELRAMHWARFIVEHGPSVTLSAPLETSEEIRRRKRQERETVHAIEG